MVVPGWLSTTASVAMAIGPPLVYADQTYSIVKKKDSTGFSRDVCAILLIANITRCFFWLGDRFEIALLIQSLLMILAQLALLAICLHYRPQSDFETTAQRSTRPLSFWHWPNYAQYVEFLAGYILVMGILTLILGRSAIYVSILGYIALGLESTLPIPQLISNFQQKSLYGFRASTLAGWLLGDAFKAVYFFVQGSPVQFQVCALMQLSVDLAILFQRFYYGIKEPIYVLPGDEDLEQALVLADADAED